MVSRRTLKGVWAHLLALLLLASCSGERMMMPTPNLYVDVELQSGGFDTIAPELKNNEVPLFYVTDRAPHRDKNGTLKYGYQRSASLAFGKAIVDLGADLTWEDLVEASRTRTRLDDIRLSMRGTTELVRTPNTPLPFREVNGKIVEEPTGAAQLERARQEFRVAITRQLALTPRKDVFIYVHGFHNDFEDAAFAMAEIWHFMGRIGVPIIYTWPAGYPGLLGYTYDRESSEFTVFHLRKTLELLASFPEVDRIHLIAHSRGTDVALNAVRELTIGARGAGIDPRRKFKLQNIILAAPDIDLQVATQRIISDRLGLSTKRFTVYASPNDGAIGFANRIFASPRGRLGSFGIEELEPLAASALAYSGSNFAIVQYPGERGASDTVQDRHLHSYFRNSPSVASDLILTLRDDIDAGDPGRPLIPSGPHSWTVPLGYPAHNAKSPGLQPSAPPQ